jgi:cyclase
MLKKRVIPTLLVLENRTVKGSQFANYRETGEVFSNIITYSAQDADELILLNINSKLMNFENFLEIVKFASKKCMIPITIGGGINKITQMEKLLETGADRVIITTGAFNDENLLKNSVKEFGAQSVVGGIDYFHDKTYIESGSTLTTTTTKEQITRIEESGVGEIFLNSIERDGMMNGYDLDFIKKVVTGSNIPVIACGGAGKIEDIYNLFKVTDCAAAACGSLFNFGDNTPIRVRSYLRNKGIEVRRVK